VYILFTGVLLIIPLFTILAQPDLQKKRNIRLKGGHSLIYDGYSQYAEHDTIIQLDRNIDYYIKKGKPTDFFYERLDQKASRKRWSKEIHNIIIRSPKQKTDTFNTKRSELEYIPYKNSYIKEIEIVKLDVFGPSINSITSLPKNGIQRFGNRLHIKTRDNIIRNHLLIKSGDFLIPEKLADSERILRDQAFIEDVRFIVVPVNNSEDSVKVVLYVKDVWSKGVDVLIEDVNAGKIDIYDKNIFGTGKIQENTVFIDPEKGDRPGYRGVFRVNNIDGSFIDLFAEYNNIFGSILHRFYANRSFYTPNIKLAGGIQIDNVSTMVKPRISSPDIVRITYDYMNLWIGRSFSFNNKYSLSSRTNIVFSTGLIYYNYKERPSINENELYQFHNRAIILGSTAYTRQSYFKSNLIYSLGKTEDIPIGVMLQYTHGFERNEFGNRLYNQVKLSKAIFLGKLGYLNGSITAGTFLKAGKHEQAVVRTDIHAFTNLYILGRFSFRHFINMSHINSFNSFVDEYASISDNYGITGLRNDSLMGKKRFKINLETTMFTPFYLAGFRIAMFGFADFCYLGKSHQIIFKEPLYTGYGFGLRIRNERLVIKTIQIRFVLYPNIPEHSKGTFFRLAGESKFKPNDFYVHAPEILKLR